MGAFNDEEDVEEFVDVGGVTRATRYIEEKVFNFPGVLGIVAVVVVPEVVEGYMNIVGDWGTEDTNMRTEALAERGREGEVAAVVGMEGSIRGVIVSVMRDWDDGMEAFSLNLDVDMVVRSMDKPQGGVAVRSDELIVEAEGYNNVQDHANRKDEDDLIVEAVVVLIVELYIGGSWENIGIKARRAIQDEREGQWHIHGIAKGLYDCYKWSGFY